MLNSLPRKASGDSDGAQRLEAYHIALTGVTRYALNLATQAILRGEHGHGFYPSPAEYRLQCDGAIEPVYRQERAYREWKERQAFNDAERKVMAQKTPEARERVKSSYEAFCARYEDQREPKPEPDWGKINARFDAERRRFYATQKKEESNG